MFHDYIKNLLVVNEMMKHTSINKSIHDDVGNGVTNDVDNDGCHDDGNDVDKLLGDAIHDNN